MPSPSSTSLRPAFRLLVKEAPRNQEFEIELESASHRPVKMVADVVWSFATAEGKYVLGARFQKALSYAALQAFSRF